MPHEYVKSCTAQRTSDLDLKRQFDARQFGGEAVRVPQVSARSFLRSLTATRLPHEFRSCTGLPTTACLLLAGPQRCVVCSIATGALAPARRRGTSGGIRGKAATFQHHQAAPLLRRDKENEHFYLRKTITNGEERKLTKNIRSGTVVAPASPETGTTRHQHITCFPQLPASLAPLTSSTMRRLSTTVMRKRPHFRASCTCSAMPW